MKDGVFFRHKWRSRGRRAAHAKRDRFHMVDCFDAALSRALTSAYEDGSLLEEFEADAITAFKQGWNDMKRTIQTLPVLFPVLLLATFVGCNQPVEEIIDGRNGFCVAGTSLYSVSVAKLKWDSDECQAYLHAWHVGVEEFGAPYRRAGDWQIRLVERPWVGVNGRVVAAETWPHGVIFIAKQPYVPADPTWEEKPLRTRACLTGVIHEVVHANELVYDVVDGEHATWGDPKNPAPGSVFYRVQQATLNCVNKE